MSKRRAVVFDLDGTLIDSAPLWPEVDQAFFTMLLGPDGWERWQPIWLAMRASGIQNYDPAIFARLIGEFSRTETLNELTHARESFLCRVYRAQLQPMRGAHEIIRHFSHQGTPVAIASGMSIFVIQRVVEQFGWSYAITAMASTHEVGKNKPEPDVYLLAARRLHADPTECLAVENELKGYDSAVRAGMLCAFVPDSARCREEAKARLPSSAMHSSLLDVLAAHG